MAAAGTMSAAALQDYHTVRQRLQGGDYGEDGMLSFASDMRSIFTNAVKYNWKPDHEIHMSARSCLRAFEFYFGKARGLDSGTSLEDPSESSSKSASKGKAAAGPKKARTPPR